MPEIDDVPTCLSPAERSLRASNAAITRWVNERDRTAATAAARAAQQHQREDEVDPNHELSPQERAKRAQQLQRLHMQRMALKSAQARRRRKAIAQRRKRGAA
jgi:hypothetical protein